LHLAGGPGSVAEIRLGEPWLRWLYLLALALVAAGIALLVFVRTAPQSDGTAVITEPGGQFAALLPVAAATDLTDLTSAAHPGSLAVVLAVPRSGQVHIAGARVQLAAPALVSRAGLAQPDQPSILLTGRLQPGEIPGGLGRLTTPVALVVQSVPVGAIVGEEFEVMLGTRAAGS
jgi:hypothetical protein